MTIVDPIYGQQKYHIQLVGTHVCMTGPMYNTEKDVTQHLWEMGGGAEVVCLLKQFIQALSGPFSLHQDRHSPLSSCLCQQDSTISQPPVKVDKACTFQDCIKDVWLKISWSVLNTRCQNGRPSATYITSNKYLDRPNACGGCYLQLACYMPYPACLQSCSQSWTNPPLSAQTEC